MARFSLVLFALLASAAASVTDPAHSHNGRRAHNKMIRVRSTDDPNVSQAPPPSVIDPTEPAPVATPAIVGEPTEVEKRDASLRFTYYETGQGACGGWNQDTDYIVALNSQDFGNGEQCWKKIGIWINGKQTEAQIVDECPGCPKGGLDFSPGLFQFFSDLGAGVLYGTWWYTS